MCSAPVRCSVLQCQHLSCALQRVAVSTLYEHVGSGMALVFFQSHSTLVMCLYTWQVPSIHMAPRVLNIWTTHTAINVKRDLCKWDRYKCQKRPMWMCSALVMCSSHAHDKSGMPLKKYQSHSRADVKIPEPFQSRRACHVLSTCHVLVLWARDKYVHIYMYMYVMCSALVMCSSLSLTYTGLTRDSFIWSAFWFISWKVQVSFQMSHLKRDLWPVPSIQDSDYHATRSSDQDSDLYPEKSRSLFKWAI